MKYKNNSIVPIMNQNMFVPLCCSSGRSQVTQFEPRVGVREVNSSGLVREPTN